jgi:hypothetical protein
MRDSVVLTSFTESVAPTCALMCVLAAVRQRFTPWTLRVCTAAYANLSLMSQTFTIIPWQGSTATIGYAALCCRALLHITSHWSKLCGIYPPTLFRLPSHAQLYYYQNVADCVQFWPTFKALPLT